MLGLAADLRLLLTRLGEIEAERSSLCLPSLEKRRTLPWALCLPCAQRGEFHALGSPITVCVGRLFDGLPALRECAFDVARDGFQTKACAIALDGMAAAFEPVGEVFAIDCANLLLGLVEIAADKTAPRSVTARRSIEDERVRVKLGIEIAASVMVKAGDGQPDDRFADRPALAPAGERVLIL